MRTRIMLVLVVCLMGLIGGGCSQSRTELFNGEDLAGWKTFVGDAGVDASDVWSISDGVIHCVGKPNGYLRTVEDYSNYKLHIEWRWAGTPSNSGVLLHATGEDKIWPLCVEAQLMHGNAGDFVTLQQGSAITVGGKRYQPPAGKIYEIAAKQHESSENAAGEWNSYDIVCDGDTIQLTVNGVLQNTATEVTLTAGAICLQSEGSAIEFRNIYIEAID